MYMYLSLHEGFHFNLMSFRNSESPLLGRLIGTEKMGMGLVVNSMSHGSFNAVWQLNNLGCQQHWKKTYSIYMYMQTMNSTVIVVVVVAIAMVTLVVIVLVVIFYKYFKDKAI